MHAAIVFTLVLLLSVLLSQLAQRTVLSLAVLFLIAGVVVGRGVTGYTPLTPSDPLVKWAAETTLVLILFADALAVDVHAVRHSWRLPTRALVVGLPLTVVGTMLLARGLAGLSWRGAVLLGAALAPTDPVFAAAIVGREGVSQRLRRLLNLESGLNDGLALPLVTGTLASYQSGALMAIGVSVVLGPAIGLAVPLFVHRLVNLRIFAIDDSYRVLAGIATGLLVLVLADLTNANAFLAVFAAGVGIAAVAPRVAGAVHGGAETVGTLAKFAAVFLFGALISPRWLARLDVADWLFVVLALVAVRPVALLIGLAGEGLPWREWVAAGWFGPKGFASVVYAILILRSGAPDGELIFHLAAAVVALSMVAHSTSDVPLAGWLARHSAEPQAADAAEGERNQRSRSGDPATGGDGPGTPGSQPQARDESGDPATGGGRSGTTELRLKRRVDPATGDGRSGTAEPRLKRRVDPATGGDVDA